MADEVNCLKEEGNNFYTKKLYAQAIKKYTEGILHEIYQSDQLDNKKIISLRQALLLNRSKCFFQTNDLKNALIDSHNCIQTQKDSKLAYKAHFQRAEIYRKLKKYENAIKHCDEIINATNKDMNAWIDRAKKFKKQIKDQQKGQKNAFSMPMTMGEHHEIITKVQNEESKQNDVAFMISAKWWKKWKNVDPQSKINANLNILSIDNSNLMSTKSEQKSEENVIEIDNESAYFRHNLRPNLRENFDYILLRFQTYQKMVKMGYKAKHIIFIKMLEEWNKNLEKMERKYEIYKTRYSIEYKSKKYIVISSKSETIRKIKSHIARYFVITSSSIRIVCNGIILDSSHSLGQHGVNENDLLFIECQHENGCWPTKKCQTTAKNKQSAPKIVCAACQRLIYHCVECPLTKNSKFENDDDQKHAAKYCNNSHLRSHSDYRKKELKDKLCRKRRKGMTGLRNLGNTCYMNSSLQCLSFIPKLRSYLLSDDYSSDINKENALGYNGKLARCMSDFFKKMWFGLDEVISPTETRIAFAHLYNQWNTRSQQDAEEFVRWLLDGLHEDLNLIQKKPYYAIPDSNGRSDEIVANEHWTLHLKRNQSVIVDLFQGQYKSTILCPKCDQQSVKFDAFSALTLPVPDKETMIPVKCLVFCADFGKGPYCLNVNVSAKAVITQLTNALNEKLHGLLSADYALMACKVVQNKFVKYFSPGRGINEIVDKNKRAMAYLYQVKSTSIAKRKRDDLILIRINFCYSTATMTGIGSDSSGDSDDYVGGMSNFKIKETKIKKIHFAYPMVFDIKFDEFTGKNLYKRVREKIKLMQRKNVSTFPTIQLKLRHDIGQNEREWIDLKESDEQIQILSNVYRRVATINVEFMEHDYKLCIDAKRALTMIDCSEKSDIDPREQNEVKLSDCLKLYTAAEILDCDVWKCSFCNAQPQPSKQLHLWRLPEILIIHLKRFINDGLNGMSNGMFSFMNGGGVGRKNHAMIKIPIHGLDLKEYLAESLHADNVPKYDLFATLNHRGQMNFGHYYSCIRTDKSTRITNYYESRHGDEEAEDEEIWHLFNDEEVKIISVKQLERFQKDAYLLFYRRRQN